MHFGLSKHILLIIRIPLCGVACLVCMAFARAQTATGYPPSVYMRFFLACPGEKPCTQTSSFHVDQIPKGCCILTVTNGDGRGNDEISNYEVLLNGQQVLSAGSARNAQAQVKVLQDNTLKVILAGRPSSKIFILIAYDPRKTE
jgi:hypothetical protein